MEKVIAAEEVISALKADVSNADKFVRYFEARIAEIEKQKSILEEAAKKAEDRAREAENKENQAILQYQKALDLKSGQYAELIKDLFETPKENLETSIRLESKKSIRIELYVAIGSIIAGIVFSLFLQVSSEKHFRESQEKLSNALMNVETKLSQSIAKNDSNISHTLLNLETNLSQLFTKSFVKLDSATLKSFSKINEIWIDNYKLRSMVIYLNQLQKDFSNYQNLNDVKLVYKFRLLDSFASTYYDIYVKALRDAGISETFIPKNTAELLNWDREMVSLYKNALKMLNAKDDKFQKLQGSDKYFESYKSKNDKTIYGKWSYQGESLTYWDLISYFERDLKQVEEQIKFNENLNISKLSK